MVYSTCTQQSLAEKTMAQHRNIQIVHRSALLAYFMSHKTGIAITGAHGKTTTSALISHIFLSLQLHPTCLIGGLFLLSIVMHFMEMENFLLLKQMKAIVRLYFYQRQ
jgi:UDP-N-acetylmuramate-alanine ligase